jgi:hypothetical protein
VNDKTKEAYRHLLYVAMLAIRTRCPSRDNAGWNPVEWYRRYHSSRVAGGLADWLHNLALFSRLEFDRFDESVFWRDHQWLCSRFPKEGLERYREIFDESVAGDGMKYF